MIDDIRFIFFVASFLTNSTDMSLLILYHYYYHTQSVIGHLGYSIPTSESLPSRYPIDEIPSKRFVTLYKQTNFYVLIRLLNQLVCFLILIFFAEPI